MLSAMLVTVVSALLVCGASLIIGQGVLRLCGRRTWSWLSAPVGLSALMLLAVPALHAPGRSTTMGVLIGLVVIAGAVAMVRDPGMRPPLVGLGAGASVLGLTLLPFAVAGRSGTLGVSNDNDMASHLLWAEAHISDVVMALNSVGPTYPMGPHALTAAIAAPLGMPVDQVFAGVTMAGPVLLGWTALAALRRAGTLGQLVFVPLVGMPLLIAGYYGQGSFKEVFIAMLALGTALALAAFPPTDGRLRWVPLGLIVAGMLSVYSYTALVWPGLFFLLWLAGHAVLTVSAGGGAVGRLKAAVSREAVPLLIGAAVTLVVLVPQLPRLIRFAQGGTGIDSSSLGNLPGRLPFWEVLGIWHSDDYRLPPPDALGAGAWGGAMSVLVVLGLAWWVRRGSWMVPAAAVGSFLIWVYSDRTASPYVTAKALVVLAPFVMLLVARPLVERDWSAWAQPTWRLLAPALLLLLVVEGLGSSWRVLRHSPIGPRDHMEQLRALRPTLERQKTLFLGNDDFLRWELPDVPVSAPFIGIPGVPTRPEKNFVYGQALDIDSVPVSAINDVTWVITPRDALGSALPSQLRLTRTTKDFALYRRVGRVAERQTLAEGGDPAAILDCAHSADARRLSRRQGVAAVREAPAGVPGSTLPAGADRRFTLPVLTAGTWDIVLQYTSGLGFTVSAPGMASVRMSPNLDRPGPRFTVGRIHLSRPSAPSIRIHVDGHPLSSTVYPAVVNLVGANPVAPERVVPLRKACGKDVDYYRLATDR